MKFSEVLESKKIKKDTNHFNKFKSGIKKHKKLLSDNKFDVVMREFGNGTLHSGSGDIVKDRDQALAIAFSEKERHKKNAS